MTTNQTPIPEPTSLTAVVVGKRDGETVVAAQMCNDDTPWVVERRHRFPVWRSWTDLCRELTDIRVVDVAEEARPTKVAGCARCDRIEAHSLGNEALLGRRRDQLAKAREEIDQLKARISEVAAKPEPGPWLRGDELKTAMPTLRAGAVVEVDDRGHKAAGELWAFGSNGLSLGSIVVRWSDDRPGPYVDALRIIERAPEPEPGADIPDEVVEAAADAINAVDIGQMGHREIRLAFARAALAAADAKQAELEGPA